MKDVTAIGRAALVAKDNAEAASPVQGAASALPVCEVCRCLPCGCATSSASVATPADFDAAWTREIANNGGADIGADYRHWMLKGWRAALADRSPAVQPVGQAAADYTPGSWFDAHTLDEMQAFYLSRLPAIREAAKEHGYAIGLHGSQRRDFDLMAMQWRADASDKDTLAHAIAVAACGITRDGAFQWEAKPNGRFAVSMPICWTDHSNPDFKKPSMGHIDLSVIDLATPAPEQEAEQLRAEQVLRRLMAYQVAGAGLYADDGELQDNTVFPFIDFKRDSVDEIERKMIERTMNVMPTYEPAKLEQDWDAPEQEAAPQLDESIATFLAEHTRLNQDGIDTHAMQMALALNYAALNPVPESDIAEWREQGYLAAPVEQEAAPTEAEPDDSDALHEAIIKVLSDHRMVHMYEVEDGGALGNSYPLIDRLSLDGARDIQSGKDEVEAIADAIGRAIRTHKMSMAPRRPHDRNCLCSQCLQEFAAEFPASESLAAPVEQEAAQAGVKSQMKFDHHPSLSSATKAASAEIRRFQSLAAPVAQEAAPVAPPGAQEAVGRAALTEFIDKVCLNKPELVACAESAFYWFNKCLTAPVPATTPAEQPEGDSSHVMRPFGAPAGQHGVGEVAKVEPDRLYQAAPRGIGRDWTPGCMCCGGGKQLYNNISFFVPSRETGEAIVGLFKTGAFLDWREFEPNWIQVKVGACDSHIDNLRQLFDAVRNGPQQDGKTCISASIIERATATNTNQPEGAKLDCPKCGANRMAEPCGNPSDCGMIGTAFLGAANTNKGGEA